MKGEIPFNSDIDKYGKYVYTGPEARPSSVYANMRQSELIHTEVRRMHAKRIFDYGCGDGSYTIELIEIPGVQKVVGYDPAEKAIEIANTRQSEDSNVVFFDKLEKVQELSTQFDLVIFRGVLHHCLDPQYEIKLASSFADTIIVLEPNGINPILKVIEKLSPYHRAHSERSFTWMRIESWLVNVGFVPQGRKVDLLVPFFFPTSLIGVMKFMEPFVKKIPYFKWLLLGTQVITAKRGVSPRQSA